MDINFIRHRAPARLLLTAGAEEVRLLLTSRRNRPVASVDRKVIGTGEI